MKKTFSNSLFFILLLLLFFSLVLVNNYFVRGVDVDLTEDQIYSLSPGSEALLDELADKLDSPINLYFFFSDNTSKGMTGIRDYSKRVESLLREYEAKSGGKINLEKIDPEPFSEAEDRAATFGLTAAATGMAQDTVYFGLAGTNALDDVMVIGFFDPQKEAFLEYDISNLIYQLSEPEPIRLTLVSDLQIAGGQNPLNGQMTPPSVLYQQLNDFFALEMISNSANELPENTELLVILHPQNINQDLLFEIDQFLMAGGEALVFVDPHFESESLAQMGAVGANSSTLELLQSYGIQASTSEVVLDAKTGLEVRGNQGNVIRHLGFLGLSDSQINDEDITTADLESINGASFGHLSLTSDSSLRQEALLSSSQNSDLIDTSQYAAINDPSALDNEFIDSQQSLVLAARYTGAATSHFADDERSNSVDFIQQATQLKLVVIADADITADRFWVQQSNFFGQTVFTPFANNGDMLINLLENLGGSEGLIGIRSRGTFARPFTKVQDIQVQAENKFRQQEQRLQAQLEETEAQLAELQSQNESLSLSPQQQAAIDQFTEQRIEIRKSLREVQFQLEKDIDRLGNQLKFLNIVFAPLVLVFVLYLMAKLLRRKVKYDRLDFASKTGPTKTQS